MLFRSSSLEEVLEDAANTEKFIFEDKVIKGKQGIVFCAVTMFCYGILFY